MHQTENWDDIFAKNLKGLQQRERERRKPTGMFAE